VTPTDSDLLAAYELVYEDRAAHHDRRSLLRGLYLMYGAPTLDDAGRYLADAWGYEGSYREERHRADIARFRAALGIVDPDAPPSAEAKLAAVERLLLEWADAPGGGMGDLLDLVEAVRRVVAS
jgi:hypothetical protein